MMDNNEVNWEEILQAGKDKPPGITILTIFHAIGSLLVIPGFLVLFSYKEEMAKNLNTIGISSIEVVSGLVLVAVLVVGSTIGLFLGTRWGWWFASYYCVYAIIQKSVALFVVTSVANQHDVGEGEVLGIVIKAMSRICVKILILIYLFRSNVWDYFGFKQNRKLIALGTLISIYLSISALSALLFWTLA